MNATHLWLAIGGGLGIAGVMWALAIVVVHLRAGRTRPPLLSTLAHRHYRARRLALAGHHAAAERHYRHLRVAQHRVHGTDHILTVHSQHQLARSLARQGKYRAAEREYRASLAARVRLLGPDHMSVFVARLQIAKMLLLQGKLEQSEAEYRALLADQTRVLGADHPDTLFTQDALGTLLRAARPTALRAPLPALAGSAYTPNIARYLSTNRSLLFRSAVVSGPSSPASGE